MTSSKLISLIGFIKPKLKGDSLLIKLEINEILANYYNFTNTLNNTQTKTCVKKTLCVLNKNNWNFVSLLKVVLKKLFSFILFLKQQMKQNRQKTVSFFIKTINLKILNTFKFLGAFFCILPFFQKSMQTGFIKLKKNNNFWCLFCNFQLQNKLDNTLISLQSILLRKIQQVYKLQRIFLLTTNKTNHNLNEILVKLRQPTVASLKNVFNTTKQNVKFAFSQITSPFFTKIKILFLKLAYFLTFFLHKVLWKWAKKKHTQASYECLLNKYWIFVQKSARFYFFD